MKLISPEYTVKDLLTVREITARWHYVSMRLLPEVCPLVV